MNNKKEDQKKSLKKINKLLISFFRRVIVGYISFSLNNIAYSFIGFFSKSRDSIFFFYPKKVQNSIIENAFSDQHPIILRAHKEKSIINKIAYIRIHGSGILLKEEDKDLLDNAITSISNSSPLIAQSIKRDFNAYYIIYIYVNKLEYNLISIFKKGEKGITLKREEKEKE